MSFRKIKDRTKQEFAEIFVKSHTNSIKAICPGVPQKKVDHEFNCRAKHWHDVAQFERKELEKVRIFRSLRRASAALATVSGKIILKFSKNDNLIFCETVDILYYFSDHGCL